MVEVESFTVDNHQKVEGFMALKVERFMVEYSRYTVLMHRNCE